MEINENNLDVHFEREIEDKLKKDELIKITKKALERYWLIPGTKKARRSAKKVLKRY